MHPLHGSVKVTVYSAVGNAAFAAGAPAPDPVPGGLSAPYVIDPAALRALTLRRRPFVTVIVTKTPRNQPRVVRQIRTA
jgi:hypothetical protein